MKTFPSGSREPVPMRLEQRVVGRIGACVCCGQSCRIVTVLVREPGKHWSYRASDCCEADIDEEA